MRVYASAPFSTGRAGVSYKHKEQIVVPNVPGGGVPSSSAFFKNPQFLISLDKSKCINPNNVRPFDVLFSYESSNKDTTVKLFLCYSTVGTFRVNTINDETIVDIN